MWGIYLSGGWLIPRLKAWMPLKFKLTELQERLAPLQCALARSRLPGATSEYSLVCDLQSWLYISWGFYCNFKCHLILGFVVGGVYNLVPWLHGVSVPCLLGMYPLYCSFCGFCQVAVPQVVGSLWWEGSSYCFGGELFSLNKGCSVSRWSS